MQTTKSRFLTKDQIRTFQGAGFVAPVDVFSEEEIRDFEPKIAQLEGLLHSYETSHVIDGWEKHNDWLYRLIMHRRILDSVEDLLGPNFYQWGSNMMTKVPQEGLYVSWHQDLHDWPLWPSEVLTVWIAFDDVDQENGCMWMLPGSHKVGKVLPHIQERPMPRDDGTRSLLPFELDPTYVDRATAVPVILKRGQVSFHHALVIHGSEGNLSTRRRAAFTACYAGTHVKCIRPERNTNGDWTKFSGFLCRGVDTYGHCPYRTPPTEFGRGPRNVFRELGNVE